MPKTKISKVLSKKNQKPDTHFKEPNNNLERLLIDTDVGSDVDDALAILFALKSPYLSVEGITTVYGKVDIRAKIAKKIVDYAGLDIPVHAGERTPINTNFPIWHVGREGEGVLNSTEYSKSLAEMDIGNRAVDFLIEKIMSNPGEYNITTLGALTNIARAIIKEPEVVKNIKHIYIMGGAISANYNLDWGSIIPATGPEHNIRCDIGAAQIVIGSSVPKTICPIDTTAHVPIDREDFEYMLDGDLSQLAVKRLVDVWFDYRDQIFGHKVEYTCMHDPLTVATIIYPDLVQQTTLPLIVDGKGITKIDDNGVMANVCYAVDFKRFRDIFLNTITDYRTTG